jgi:erythromycin esterase-like protein
MVAAWSPVERAVECEATVARHLFWRYDARQPFDTQEQLRLQRCARGAADSASVRTRRHRGDTDSIMLGNLAGYVDRQVDASHAPDRDDALYRNVLLHAGRMPAGSKLIIWTATVHAARRQGELPHRPLGARLAAKWGRRVAVVGFTARGGETSMAGQPPKRLPEAPPGSLEARATAGEEAWAYANPSALRRIGRVPSRLLGRFTSADWSTYFDHVVVVRKEVAPTFE